MGTKFGKLHLVISILFITSACGNVTSKLFERTQTADLGSLLPGPTPTPTPSGSGYKVTAYQPNSTIEEVAFDSTGRKITVGNFWSVVRHSRGLFSLNMDGSVNENFDAGLGAEDSAHTIRKGAYQSDGKLVVVGRFNKMSGVTTTDIQRLNADGTPDTSFAVTGTGFNSSYIEDVVIQSDGKIIVVGNFSTYNGVTARGVARLNSNGSLDTTFATNTGTGANSLSVYSVSLQSDGKILVGGGFTSFNGQANTTRLVRLNTDGSVDNTFTPGTGFDNTINKLKVLGDDKILVGGNFTTVNGSARPALARLTAAGVLDGSFSPPAFLAARRVYALNTQSDGKILIGGNFTGTDSHCLARLEANGTHDSTFKAGTVWDCSDSDWVGGITILPGVSVANDKIIVSGQKYTDLVSYADSIGVLVHQNDGTLDPAFDSDLGIGIDTVDATLVAPDGSLMVMGSFSWIGSYTANGIYRETSVGEFDTSFTMGTGFSGGTATSLLVYSDGSLLVGGFFTQYDGSAAPRLIKLQADGTVDTSFSVGAGFAGGGVNDMALQADGKIVVVGTFTTYQGTSVPRIARLNSDGSLDTSLIVGTGFTGGGVNQVRIQSDGQILAAGAFTAYKGTSINRLARINGSDGGLDTSLTVGTGFNSTVNDMTLDEDENILLVGNFITYAGATFQGLVRLLPTGIADTSFVTGTGFGGASVQSVTIREDGKILIGGYFTSYQGTGANYLVQLLTDGTRDSGFVLGDGFDSAVFTLTKRPGGELLVGGDFFSYQNSRSASFALIKSDGSLVEN